jgi:hypothetical protein
MIFSTSKAKTKVNFRISNRRLPSSYISSIPKGLNLVSVYEFIKPRCRGGSNGFIFYDKPFSYISARFNLNDSKVDETLFLFRIETMFSTLHKLNGGALKSMDVLSILKHIREYSNYVFDVRALFFMVKSFTNNPSLVKVKSRDFAIAEFTVYERNIDFLNALNNARRVVNSNFNLDELFCLLEERITNNDYGYINDVDIIGHKDHNLLIYAMVRKFNLLCTGQQRQRRKQAKSEPLYCNSIKRLTLKSISLKPQQQNGYLQKGIIVYERELIAFNRLINNRKIAQQMFMILADIIGVGFDFDNKPDPLVQNQLKAELLNLIYKKDGVDVSSEALEFDRLYPSPVKKAMPLKTDLSNIFDTDMTNSIFNQLSSVEAICEGFAFYVDYLVFTQYHKKAA